MGINITEMSIWVMFAWLVLWSGRQWNIPLLASFQNVWVSSSAQLFLMSWGLEVMDGFNAPHLARGALSSLMGVLLST